MAKLVSVAEIREAAARLHGVAVRTIEAHLVAEPGGAAAVTACLFRRDELPPARQPVAVLSGGNIGPALLARVISQGRATAGPGAH